MYHHHSQLYGHQPHRATEPPDALHPIYRPGPEFLYRPAYVPEVPFEHGPYGPNGSFYNMGRHIAPSYASADHGVMPEINWSAMPAPHNTMTNISYMYDPMQNGHMMGRASAPQTHSHYNETVLARRHEIELTVPTNRTHDQIHKMRMHGVLTRDEMRKLLNETPGSDVGRDELLKHLKKRVAVQTCTRARSAI